MNTYAATGELEYATIPDTDVSRAEGPVPRALWKAVVAADPTSLACQTPEWADAMVAAGNWADASRHYRSASGARIVMPLLRLRGPWPRAAAPLHSMPPGWGMGGPTSEAGLTATDLAAIVADLRQLSSVRIGVRPNPLHADLWDSVANDSAQGITRVDRTAHILDLSGGPEEIWTGRFRSSARRSVRKAEKAGLEVRCGSDPRLIKDFHRLLELSFERWAENQSEPLWLARWRGKRRDPLSKFLDLADSLGDALRVWVAYLEGTPVASLVVLIGRDASYTRGAMDKQLAGPVAANDLLQWLAIRDACKAGCARYHMGETGESTSLARYKEKLGAQPVPYHEYRFERLPITATDARLRRVVKRTIGFRDV